MGTTLIEWTAKSWNPIAGCSIASEGCRNCYAAELAATRLKNHPTYRGLAEYNRDGVAQFTGRIQFIPAKLFDPLRAKKPTDWFVNSMSDLFHPLVKHSERAAILGVIAAAGDHVLKGLTKRPGIAKKFFENIQKEARDQNRTPVEVCIDYAMRYFQAGTKDLTKRVATAIADKLNKAKYADIPFPIPNFWFGVSAEDQKNFDMRVEELLACPVAKRWVSVEPMLGPIKAGEYLVEVEPDEYPFTDENGDEDWTVVDPRPALDWIVCGGESGPNSRPFDIDAARSIMHECADAGVAFFLKQFGRFPQSTVLSASYSGHADYDTANQVYYYRLKDEKGGDPAEWPEDMRVREYPTR